MTEERSALYKSVATIVFGIMLLLVVLDAEATGKDNTTINNYETNNYYEVVDPGVTDPSVNTINYRITDSLSASDLVEIISGTMAAGSHQFDWVTTRWQISITGATTSSDWDEDIGFSFAIAKRFGQDSSIPNALWHLAYTPDIQGNDYINGGATILLGGP